MGKSSVIILLANIQDNSILCKVSVVYLIHNMVTLNRKPYYVIIYMSPNWIHSTSQGRSAESSTIYPLDSIQKLFQFRESHYLINVNICVCKQQACTNWAMGQHGKICFILRRSKQKIFSMLFAKIFNYASFLQVCNHFCVSTGQCRGVPATVTGGGNTSTNNLNVAKWKLENIQRAEN